MERVFATRRSGALEHNCPASMGWKMANIINEMQGYRKRKRAAALDNDYVAKEKRDDPKEGEGHVLEG
jgi:hypothetical protein